MIEQFAPEIQAIVSTVVIAVLGLLSAMVVKTIKTAEVKFNSWLDSKTNVEQRELLHKYGKEAFSFAETLFTDLKGEEKLNKAKEYLQSQLKSIGIVVTDDEIKAVIEKAVLDYNSKK